MNRPLRPEDRRQFGRIHFETPIAARLGESRVNLVDLALDGARVTSDARFTPAATLELKFESDSGPISLMCSVIRCTLAQFAQSPGEKSVYQTGLHILETAGRSDDLLREMIASHVVHALEEQKANARGIPPVLTFVNERGAGGRYRKCELLDGKWRRTETSSPNQPFDGFTISAGVEIRYVEMLCETYQRSDTEGRRLTRILAELSVTHGEGVRTRKYIP